MSALLLVLFNLLVKPIIKARMSGTGEERAVLEVCEDLLSVVDDAISMAQDGWDVSDRLLLKSSLERLLENAPRDIPFPREAVAETLSWAIDKIASSTKKRVKILRRKESPR